MAKVSPLPTRSKAGKCAIIVAVRIRPLNDEKEADQEIVWEEQNGNTISEVPDEKHSVRIQPCPDCVPVATRRCYFLCN
jgi:hypothetical protein